MEDKDYVIRDTFYIKLEVIYEKCPANDFKIVLGGFNANVGLDISASNGIMLIDLMAASGFIISTSTKPLDSPHDPRSTRLLSTSVLSLQGRSGLIKNLRSQRTAKTFSAQLSEKLRRFQLNPDDNHSAALCSHANHCRKL